MAERGWETAYRLHKESRGRLPLRTAYNLVSAKGRIERFDGPTLEALLDTFRVPIETLLVRERRR